jgi:hypothetical protein
MAYHPETASVILALNYEIRDFEFHSDGLLVWNHADPQPTEQVVNDYATDTTPLPSGGTFSQWVATHGGDAIATAKRIARELQDADDAQNRAARAMVKIVVDEVNALRQWIADYKTQVAAAANLADLKTRVAAMPNLPGRSYAQAKTAIIDHINGE